MAGTEHERVAAVGEGLEFQVLSAAEVVGGTGREQPDDRIEVLPRGKRSDLEVQPQALCQDGVDAAAEVDGATNRYPFELCAAATALITMSNTASLFIGITS